MRAWKSVLSPGSPERYIESNGGKWRCRRSSRVTRAMNKTDHKTGGIFRGPSAARREDPGQEDGRRGAGDGRQGEPGRTGPGRGREEDRTPDVSGKQCLMVIEHCFCYRFSITDAGEPGTAAGGGPGTGSGRKNGRQGRPEGGYFPNRSKTLRQLTPLSTSSHVPVHFFYLGYVSCTLHSHLVAFFNEFLQRGRSHFNLVMGRGQDSHGGVDFKILRGPLRGQ